MVRDRYVPCVPTSARQGRCPKSHFTLIGETMAAEKDEQCRINHSNVAHSSSDQ